ncbi:hypothetical protein QBZ16_000564 [Prototheca wickerhamii]|uniref:Uncharacterized protein n=1 Tax=Prototheca wickerhamii TaxID=3111 RepID=A0AAD9INE2_PROWI|nr:hypothetical protein QBZ16_000564 [Prototheca wickerhamii]
MKEVTVSHVFDGYSPEALFGLLSVRHACQKAYHAAINHDPEASIPDWDLDTRSRTLTYFKPLDAPAMIRKLAGADALRVVDTQSVSRQASPEGSILLSSNPIPEMPGANKFQAPVSMLYRRCAGGSCEVVGTVTCTAAGPFGLSGTIESFMAETARTSLLGFFEFAAGFLASLEDADGSLRREAAEEAERLLGPVLEERVPFVAGPGSDVWADALADMPLPAVDDAQAPALYLRYLCSTGDQGVALLSRIDERLAALQSRQAGRSVPSAVWFAAGFASGLAATALLLGLRSRAATSSSL